jgi:isoquinoline 1-oxidoreductase beta subunit
LRRYESADVNTDVDKATLHPNVFVGIETDGTVWIVAHRSEMGTVIRTSLPMVVADELDADWTRVKIDQAIGDSRYGDQNTDGSQSIRGFFDPMRLSGATARLMLVQAAAQRWGVPVSECQTDLHAVVHSSSARRLAYGELATAASKLPVPKKDEVQLKSKAAWRYVGKGMTSYDLTDLVTGKAVYGVDAHLDGMLFASIVHPPVLGGKIKAVDNGETLRVAGVSQTVVIDPFKPRRLFSP